MRTTDWEQETLTKQTKIEVMINARIFGRQKKLKNLPFSFAKGRAIDHRDGRDMNYVLDLLLEKSNNKNEEKRRKDSGLVSWERKHVVQKQLNFNPV